MIDDVFIATAFVGVSAIVAAAFVGSAVEPAAIAEAQSKPVVVQARVKASDAAAMPVYELPRVVVTGHRSRDGDQFASTAAQVPAEATAPPRRTAP